MKQLDQELFEAIKHYHPLRAEAAIAAGANVNARGAVQETPLHWTAIYDHPDIARLLIEKGAEVNSPDAMGNTPLHVAARYGRTSIAQALIDQ